MSGQKWYMTAPEPSFIRSPIAFIIWHSMAYKRCAQPSCRHMVYHLRGAGWQVASAITVAILFSAWVVWGSAP